MTEQFMENISNEEHERLLLLCGHGIGPPLSPAAQAVLDGFRAVPNLMDGPSIAGALRAAADQCHSQKIREADHTTRRWICVDELLAIATELEHRHP